MFLNINDQKVAITNSTEVAFEAAMDAVALFANLINILNIEIESWTHRQNWTISLYTNRLGQDPPAKHTWDYNEIILYVPKNT